MHLNNRRIILAWKYLNKKEGWAFSTMIMKLFEVPKPHNLLPGFLFQFFTNVHPCRWQMVAQVLESLMFNWKIWLGFPASGSAWPASGYRCILGVEQRMEYCFLYPSLSLCFPLSNYKANDTNISIWWRI